MHHSKRGNLTSHRRNLNHFLHIKAPAKTYIKDLPLQRNRNLLIRPTGVIETQLKKNSVNHLHR